MKKKQQEKQKDETLEERVLVISQGKEIYVPRSEAHNQGWTRVIVAGVIVDEKQRIFLQYRNKHGDPHDGFFTTSFAGHVNERDKAVAWWDIYIMAALREQKEELGIQVDLRYWLFHDFEESNERKFYYDGRWNKSDGLLRPNPQECNMKKSRFYDINRISNMINAVDADGQPIYRFSPSILFYLGNKIPQLCPHIEGLNI